VLRFLPFCLTSLSVLYLTGVPPLYRPGRQSSLSPDQHPLSAFSLSPPCHSISVTIRCSRRRSLALSSPFLFFYRSQLYFFLPHHSFHGPSLFLLHAVAIPQTLLASHPLFSSGCSLPSLFLAPGFDTPRPAGGPTPPPLCFFRFFRLRLGIVANRLVVLPKDQLLSFASLQKVLDVSRSISFLPLSLFLFGPGLPPFVLSPVPPIYLNFPPFAWLISLSPGSSFSVYLARAFWFGNRFRPHFILL